jgi:hypothetical protein
VARRSKTVYPGAQFLGAEEYDSRAEKSCTYAFMSGIFNLAVGQDDNFVHGIIGKYFSIAEKALIFNAVSSYVNFVDNRMFYFDLPAIIDHVSKNLSPIFEVRHGFLPHNFSMCIWKGGPWLSLTERQRSAR